MSYGEEFQDKKNGWAATLTLQAMRDAIRQEGEMIHAQHIEGYLRSVLAKVSEVRTIQHHGTENISAIYVGQKFEKRLDTVDRQIQHHTLSHELALNEAGVDSSEPFANLSDPMETFFLAPDPVEIWTEDQVIENLVGPARYVIRGAPGQGKSMFMQQCCIKIAESGRIPVLLELRRLNEKGATLQSLIYKTLGIPTNDSGVSIFTSLVNKGAFVFLLDGLDEVYESRQRLATSDEISGTFRDALHGVPVIVTSRSEQSELLRGFDTLKLVPFDIDQAMELAKRVSKDDKNFIKNFKDNYYSRMPSLFGIPMFIHILYVSKESSRPYSGLGDFLDRAIDHMSHGHDSLKEDYDRPKYEGYEALSHDLMMKHLSIPLYIRSGTPMRKIPFQRQIEKAKIAANKNVNRTDGQAIITASSDDILNTLVKSIALVTSEGGNYEFKIPILLEFYVASYFLKDLDAMKVSRKKGVMLMIEKGWVYKIMESLDSYRLHSRLVRPVSKAVLEQVAGQRDLASRLQYMVGSLVIDLDAGRAYLRSDGDAQTQRVVWSLLTNCLAKPNIVLLATDDEFNAFHHKILKLRGRLPESGEVIVKLAELSDEFFDLPEMETALKALLGDLEMIFRHSNEAAGEISDEIPDIYD